MSLAISAKNWPNLGQKPFSWLFETLFGNINCTKHMQPNSDFRHGIRNHNKVQEPPRAPKSVPDRRETTPESAPYPKETTSKSAPPPEDTTSRAHHIKESSPSRRYHAQGTPRAEETSAALYLRVRSLLRVVSPARGIFWMGSSL